MKKIKLLGSKNYWRYIFSLKKTANAILGTLGVIWLLVEASSFFSVDLSNFFKAHWLWLLILGVVWVIYENWPQTEFCYKLKDRDIRIQLSIGDLFSYPGDLIIPTNSSLDTSFNENLISKESTQGQFTIKYFKEARYLEQDIQLSLAGKQPVEQLPDKKKGNKYRYEIGEVIKLTLPEDKFTYLPITSHINNEGIAYTNFDNILVSLGKLWEFLIEKGELNELNMPVIGTGRGRILETRETIIKTIIYSFISATTSSKKFCNKLNIVVHPKDFSDHEINIKELKDILRLKTIYNQYDTKTVGTGQAVG
jgi:hypothetical protein